MASIFEEIAKIGSGLNKEERIELLEAIAKLIPNLAVPFSKTTASYTIPAINAEVGISVDYNTWMQVGMILQIGSVVSGKFQGGWYRIESLTGTTTVNAKLLSKTGDGITVSGSWVNVAGASSGTGVNPVDYGADPTGATDSIEELEAAITAAQVSGSCLLIPAYATFAISRTLKIPANMCVQGEGEFLYTATTEEPAIIVNEQLGVPVTTTASLNLSVTRQNQSNWSNEANIGIKIINSLASLITIRKAWGFTIGVQCLGDTSGFQHNIVTLEQIRLNKIGVELNTADNPTVGWCNENLFLGGHFGSGNTNQALGRYGIRITSTVGYYNNNNVFIKPSFQMGPNPLGAVDSIGCDVTYGGSNKIISARYEGTSHACRFSNGSNSNDFEFYAGADGGDYRDSYIDNSNNVASHFKYPNKVSFNQTSTQQQPISTWHSGLLHERAAMNSAGEVFVPGVFFWDTTQAAPVNKTIPSRVKINTIQGCLEGFKQVVGGQSTAIGVRVDTSVVKEFLIGRECLDADGSTTVSADLFGSGRLIVKPMDANLTVLDQPTFPEALKGAAGSYSNTGAMSNRWFEGVDHDIPFTPGDPIVVANSWIKVSEDVKFVDIMLASGTKSMKLRSFSISTRDFSMPAVDSVVWRDKSLASKVACDEVPVSRYFEEGTIITNLDLGANPEVGWMLTAGNYATNGAWANVAVVKGEWRSSGGNIFQCDTAGTTTIAPVDVSGASVDAGDGIFWTFIAAGTPATWTLFGPNFISSFIKTLLDDATASDARDTLGLGAADTVSFDTLNLATQLALTAIMTLNATGLQAQDGVNIGVGGVNAQTGLDVAGTDLLTVGTDEQVQTYSFDAGVGVYDYDIDLDTASAFEGAIFELKITKAASANPTIAVRDGSGGSDLVSLNNANAETYYGRFVFDGTNWVMLEWNLHD